MARRSTSNGLKVVVSEQVYSVWLDMLRRLVPEGRTHRLAPTIAAMLQYATDIASEKYGDDVEEGSVASRLRAAYDSNDEELLLPFVQKLFDDAGVQYKRRSKAGVDYSVAEEAV